MAPSRHSTALATTLALGPIVLFPFDVRARGGGHSSGSTPRSSSSASRHRSALSGGRKSIQREGCPRDSRGKIKRDPKAPSELKRTNPKPPGCNKCEVDHIVPLSKGGRDEPSNRQWLTKEPHQDKTKRNLRQGFTRKPYM
jgi:5-methylcytosine-specific restriction endonuclease McrA